MKNKQKKKEQSAEQLEIIDTKDFFDRTVPGVIRFYTDHYICGNFYKSCWAVTEYPSSTEETAILAHLADRNGVTLRIYNRLVPKYSASIRLMSDLLIRRAANPCSEIALSTRLMMLKICSSFSRLNRTANINCLAEDIST